MSPNKGTFVRAKPMKIVIEELYQYKADVTENPFLSFEKDKSRGTIKVEFVYDGERLPSGWERSVLLRGLRDKWKLPNRIGRRINAWREKPFVGPAIRGVGWLIGRVWRVIRWLPGYLIRQCLKPNLRPDASKSFGVPALADVERYGGGLTKALVGRLALRGYSKPTFDEDWPEYCTLPLKMPVGDSESKISSSRKHVIRYRYSLKEPKKSPVRLGDVSLCDEVSYDKRGDRNVRLRDDARGNRTDMGEMLWLEIPLIVDIEPSDLDEKNQLKPDIAKDLWKKGKRRWESQEKRATAQKNEEEEEDLPFADQLAFFPEWDDSAISEALSRLSHQRGGYLFFTIDNEKDGEALEKLQEEVLKVALKCNPPVPIMKPYAIEDPDKQQQLVIVPVPQRVIRSSGQRRGLAQMEGRFTYDGVNITESRAGMGYQIEIGWGQLTKSDDSLAKTLVALANTKGGYVTIEIGPMSNYDKALAEVIQRAHDCRPPMTRWIYILLSSSARGNALRMIVPPRLPYIFTYKDTAWVFKGSEVEAIRPDDIYELFKERSELHYPTLDPPVVTYACIEWPHMDHRKRQGIRHDPENRVLEWVDKEAMQQTAHDAFEATLDVKIMHPIEFYQTGHVRGQIRVQFNRRILSGLDVEYFDATGQRRPHGNEHRPERVRSTTVVINLDVVANAIFERRPFYPYRRLEFEGVKPDPDRLADIISLLADLGLEDIDARPIFPFGFSLDLSDPATFEEVVSKEGILITGYSHERNLQVKLKVEGSPQTIGRERKNGQRLDKMQVTAGQLRITVEGESKGESPLELSTLLNQIQHLLKERFSFVRMHLQ